MNEPARRNFNDESRTSMVKTAGIILQQTLHALNPFAFDEKGTDRCGGISRYVHEHLLLLLIRSHLDPTLLYTLKVST